MGETRGPPRPDFTLESFFGPRRAKSDLQESQALAAITKQPIAKRISKTARIVLCQSFMPLDFLPTRRADSEWSQKRSVKALSIINVNMQW